MASPQTATAAPIPASAPEERPPLEGFGDGGLTGVVLFYWPFNGTRTPFQVSAQSFEDGKIDPSWSAIGCTVIWGYFASKRVGVTDRVPTSQPVLAHVPPPPQLRSICKVSV